MQRVTSGSKRKSSEDALAKFERAQKLFQDIESIIDQEIATTPLMAANYESNIARIKKNKRKRPGLIRNTNTKKNRQVINNMEYDPETNTWLGNEDALSVFSPLQPALITSRGRIDKEKVVSGMTWDPAERTWKGNEKDALKFASPRKPGLIAPLRGSNYLKKEVQGMVFDPITMRWMGNDEEVDIFSSIDHLDDDGFAVGEEFHLPAALAKSFVDCANRHKSSLSGWFADGAIDRKAHLYAIRNMSILRIVRDVKQRTTYVDLDDDTDANVPERDVPSPVQGQGKTSKIDGVQSQNGNSADASEDYDDLPFTGSAKLKLPEIGEDDWDKDFDMDTDEVPTSIKNENNNNGSNTHRLASVQLVPNGGGSGGGKKGEEAEDWDSDFAEADADAFKSKLKLPSSIKKPFQLDPTNKRGSVIDLSSTRGKSSLAPTSEATKPAVLVGEVKEKKKTKPAVVEEDDEGFDLPPGPIRLVHTAVKQETEEGEQDLDGMEDLETPHHGNEEKAGSGFEEVMEDEGEGEGEGEEEEEDWTDVDVPVTFPTTPIKRSHDERETEDWGNDNDIEIPKNAILVVKKPKTSDDESDELGVVSTPANDDMFDDLEIPDDFAARLRK